MKYIFPLLVFFISVSAATAQIMPENQAPSDTTETIHEGLENVRSNGLSVSVSERDSLRDASQASKRVQPTVYPLQQRIPTGFQTVFTDSLLRWEQWFNLAERENNRRGSITYRLGAHGRNDGIMHRAIEPRYRRIYFDGIPFNDPISGASNTNLLPLDRMRTYADQSSGAYYQSWFELDRFYLTEPITWINVENTAYDVRRAEGILSTNIDRQTNVELSYRGNNDGSEYRRNTLSGRQASIRVSHYLNDRWFTQGLLFYNSFQMDESQGFVVDDPFTFPFIPDFVTPVSNNSNSTLRNTLVSASLYYRPDKETPSVGKIHLYEKRYRRFFRSTSDSTSFRTKTWGMHSNYRLNRGIFTLEPTLNIRYTGTDDDNTRSITKSQWSEFEGRLSASIQPVDRVRLNLWGIMAYRTDNEYHTEGGYRIDINLLRNFRLFQSLSHAITMPTIQQKYWTSNRYSGNPNLANEQISRLEAGLVWGRGWMDAIGLSVYASQITNPIVNNLETGEFINIDSYQSVGSEIYFDIESKYFEISASTTFQTYLSQSSRLENINLEDSGFRIWNKFSAFYKNYFFDFATYAKVGFRGVFSPNPYYSSRYLPILDYWDPLSDEHQIPMHFRLDAEASARVRNVIFTLRYENILDGAVQNGYFETAGFPMPSRRYRVGFRWILRN